MGEAHYAAVAKVPLAKAWNFCKEMSNWGPSMPGYAGHELLDDTRSAWTFQIDLGPFSRRTVMDVIITEGAELQRVSVEIQGRTEPFIGSGQFRIEEDADGTRLYFDITITPQGVMGRMVDAMAHPI